MRNACHASARPSVESTKVPTSPKPSGWQRSPSRLWRTLEEAAVVAESVLDVWLRQRLPADHQPTPDALFRNGVRGSPRWVSAPRDVDLVTPDDDDSPRSATSSVYPRKIASPMPIDSCWMCSSRPTRDLGQLDRYRTFEQGRPGRRQDDVDVVHERSGSPPLRMDQIVSGPLTGTSSRKVEAQTATAAGRGDYSIRIKWSCHNIPF